MPMLKAPDFLIIPHQVYTNNKLQPLDWGVYGVCYWFEKLKDGKCTAGNGTIAEVLNLGRSNTQQVSAGSVANSLIRLEEQNCIRRIFADKNRRRRKEIQTLVAYVSPNNETVSSNDERQVSSNDEQNKKTKKEKKKTILQSELKKVLTVWNGQSITQHKKVTDKMQSAFNGLRDDLEYDQVVDGVKIYGAVFNSPDTYFKHKWTLEEFLKRANGCRVFAYKSLEDYLTNKSYGNRRNPESQRFSEIKTTI